MGRRGFDFGEPAKREDGTVRIPVRIPADLSFFEGHFPGDPIVPGIAQLVAVVENRARHVWPELGAVRGIRRLKFMRSLRPNDELVLVLERDEDRGQVRFVLQRDGSECSRGALLFDASTATAG